MLAAFSYPIDGSIVGLYLLVTMIAGVMVRKYVSKVDHFLVAGREMNVYLGIASLAATEFGIITCMYTAQNGYKYGFAGATPGIIQAAAMLLIGLTGFCVKPLRDSGVMTIPELFERRFGPRIRWLAGVVIALGGLLNMGIFLRVGGEFLVITVGFDPRYLEMTMTVLLVAVCVYTILGGMLSVLITDFLQFIVMSAGMLLVTYLVLWKIGWGTLVSTVETNYGAGGFNPIINKDLGWSYIIFQVCIQTAATLCWQAVTARLLAAKDSRTGRKVFTGTAIFFFCRFLIPGLWGIAALAMLGWHPLERLTHQELASIPQATQTIILDSQAPDAMKDLTDAEKDALPNSIRNKLDNISLHEMPRFLATFLPVGIIGLLIAAMLAADMSTDSSYMLTWASVIYNDILGPFRRGRVVSEKRGLLWNRMIVAVIGIYLLFFGLWYKLEGDLWTYCTITGSIYLASMSVLLIACCYWKRANSWGAAGAIICGAVFPIAFLVMQKLPATQGFVAKIGPNWSGIAAYAAAAIAMVVGSLMKPASITPARTE